MSGEQTLKAVRGSFLDITRTVEHPEEIESALRFVEDGLLLIRDGKVAWFGEWEDGKAQIPPRFAYAITGAKSWCRGLSIPIFTIRKVKWSGPTASSCWSG